MVSFPPLIDMLKFSGYPYLIRGQPLNFGGVWQATGQTFKAGDKFTELKVVPDRH